MQKIKVFSEERDIYVYRHMHLEPEAVHKHTFFEIEYIFSGNGVQSVNGHEFPVKRGDLLLLGFNDVHAFRPAGQMGILNCLVKPAFISEKLTDSYDIQDVLSLLAYRSFQIENFLPVLNFSDDYGKVESILFAMEKESAEEKKCYQNVLSNYLDILFIVLFRKMWDTVKTLPNEHIMSRISQDVLYYISENYAKKITLAELSAKSFYNPSYFSKMFKECFGKTVTTYIQELRIDAAVQLLENSSKSIEEIAYEVGLGDKKNFYRVFKRFTGKLPGEYRKE